MEYALLLLSFLAPVVFNKIRLPAWLSTVLLCYSLGLALSALVGAPVMLAELVHAAIQGCVAIAIPAMLLQASWKRVAQMGKPGLFAGLSLWIGALSAALLLLATQVEVNKVAMIFAIFTGGLANLQAAGIAFGLEAQELVAANLGDVMAGGVLFIALSSIGPAILDRILGKSVQNVGFQVAAIVPTSSISVLSGAISLVLATACLLVGLGLSQVLPKGGEDYKELIILGGASIAAISLGQVLTEKRPQLGGSGSQVGEYLMLVFCVLIGWSADWTQVGASSLSWAATMAIFLGIQLLVAVGLAKIFKIEASLFLIALVGSVYSPAFVPPIATSIKRTDLVAAGVLIGLIGLALATPFAILFARVFA